MGRRGSRFGKCRKNGPGRRGFSGFSWNQPPLPGKMTVMLPVIGSPQERDSKEQNFSSSYLPVSLCWSDLQSSVGSPLGKHECGPQSLTPASQSREWKGRVGLEIRGKSFIPHPRPCTNHKVIRSWKLDNSSFCSS